MITSILLRRRRRKVHELANLVDAERELLRNMTTQVRSRVEDRVRGEWAIAGCFGAGLATGWFGRRLAKPIKRIPFMMLFRQVRPYLGLLI